MVEEEELQFHEEYMNENDPSILHFLLASGDDVWWYFLRQFSILIQFFDQQKFHAPTCRSPASNSAMIWWQC